MSDTKYTLNSKALTALGSLMLRPNSYIDSNALDEFLNSDTIQHYNDDDEFDSLVQSAIEMVDNLLPRSDAIDNTQIENIVECLLKNSYMADSVLECCYEAVYYAQETIGTLPQGMTMVLIATNMTTADKLIF